MMGNEICPHGIEYRLCMERECEQAISRALTYGSPLKDYGEANVNEILDYERSVDMDNILDHECQHGSDMRVCENCKKIDDWVRDHPSLGLVMVRGKITTFLYDGNGVLEGMWNSRDGELINKNDM